MISRTATGLLALMALAAPAAFGPAAAQTPSADDATFVSKAVAGNAFEVEEARLAVQRATDPKVKQFAQKMIDDHADALKKLAQAAGKPDVATAPALDAMHQATLDNLKAFNGSDFDKIYKADQVMSHAATVALLSDYVQNGGNGGLKSWAKNTLSEVKEHRAAIDAM